MILEPLFQQAVPVLEKIEEAGYEAYFVGGCVRDALLGKPISDVDIASSALPLEIKGIFPKTVDIGIEHGTVLVLSQQSSYEITTFRTESEYEDFRRPDHVTFVRSLEEDLKRRDFTINALAMDLRGKIYDFHQGQEDLNKQAIRAVGAAVERFHEDALRMMRGVRFVAQLGFEMEEGTQEGIVDNAALLEKIAIERIRVEYQKMVTAPFKAKGMALFIKTGLSQHTVGFQDGQEALKKASQVTLTQDTFETNFASYFFYRYGSKTRGDHPQVVKTLNDWKLSNQEKADIKTLLDILAFRAEQNWSVFDLFEIGHRLSVLGEGLAADLGVIDQATPVAEAYAGLPIKSMKDLALNGKALMAHLGLSSGGPLVGKALNALKLSVLKGQVENRPEALKAWLDRADWR